MIRRHFKLIVPDFATIPLNYRYRFQNGVNPGAAFTLMSRGTRAMPAMLRAYPDQGARDLSEARQDGPGFGVR